MTTIAERLKEARRELDLSQDDVAQLAGVSPGTIGNLENGARKNPRNLLEIAAAVQVLPMWLKTGRPPKRPPHWMPPQPPSEGVIFHPVAQDLIHPTAEDEPPKITWEFILSGADLPARFTAAVPDDALASVTPRGTEFIFSTTSQPGEGVVVIVQASNGRRYMRLYFAGADDEWEARARDPAHPSLHSVRDGLRLLAAATHRAGGHG